MKCVPTKSAPKKWLTLRKIENNLWRVTHRRGVNDKNKKLIKLLTSLWFHSKNFKREKISNNWRCTLFIRICVNLNINTCHRCMLKSYSQEPLGRDKFLYVININSFQLTLNTYKWLVFDYFNSIFFAMNVLRKFLEIVLIWPRNSIDFSIEDFNWFLLF